MSFVYNILLIFQESASCLSLYGHSTNESSFLEGIKTKKNVEQRKNGLYSGYFCQKLETSIV